MMAGESRIGVTGLAVMGANLARNIGRHGVPVAVHNRTAARTTRFMEAYGGEGTFTAAENPEDFVAVLARPRRILIMVKVGAPVDGVIEELSPLLDEVFFWSPGAGTRKTVFVSRGSRADRESPLVERDILANGLSCPVLPTLSEVHGGGSGGQRPTGAEKGFSTGDD
jgi:3-hydroxyisobutyrate dehydrogenase-like beta-hydroxyacid dehydrogenase